MNKNICVPGKYDSVNRTCFSLEQVIELVKAFNKHITKTNLNPTKKKSYKATPITTTPDKSKLLDDLNDRFKSVCSGDESCLLRQDFMNEIVKKEMYEDIVHNTFRAVGPPGSTDWLSTDDIDQIMHPYERVFPNFKFLGAVPSDCDAVKVCVLHDLDFDAYVGLHITQLGIIFNHDTHKETGSHWVSMYINIPEAKLFYVDSVGKNPVGRMDNVIKKFEQYCDANGRKITYKKNTNSYQTDDSECGVYSCNFLIRLLAGESFEHIVQNPLDFQGINSCRNVYFSNQSSKFKINKMCDPNYY